MTAMWAIHYLDKYYETLSSCSTNLWFYISSFPPLLPSVVQRVLKTKLTVNVGCLGAVAEYDLAIGPQVCVSL